MKAEYDFRAGKRGPILPIPRGKIRAVLLLDENMVEWFRGQVNPANGGDWEDLINRALREYIARRQATSAVGSRKGKKQKVA